MTVKENVYVTGSVLGLKMKEIDEKFNEIIGFAELEEFIDAKLRFLSSGMRQRLAFSIAVNASADIIYLDEVFAVGDEKFKEKATSVFEEAWVKGRTVIMVSHGLNNIKKYCNRAILLNKGKIVFDGDPDEAINKYHALN